MRHTPGAKGSTGLHFADIDQLIDVLHRLVDRGNTVVTSEHNLDLGIVKEADCINCGGQSRIPATLSTQWVSDHAELQDDAPGFEDDNETA